MAGIDESTVRNCKLQKDEKVDPRLRTRGNMVERAFIYLTDKLDKLKNKPVSEKHDDLIRKLVTFVCMDGNNMRNARTVGCLGNNDAKLFPKT